jgi:hypothetical protein
MRANGDSGKPIWGTEFGYPTCTGDFLCVSEAEQARYIGEAIDLWSGYSWAGPLMLYQTTDFGPADVPLNRFGLFRQDLSPKPSVAAVRARTGA